MRWLFGEWRSTFPLMLAVVGLAPSLLHAAVTGSDVIANSLAVLVFLVLAVFAQGRHPWPGWVAAGLLGVAISWRDNFLLLMSLALSASALGRGRHDQRRA